MLRGLVTLLWIVVGGIAGILALVTLVFLVLHLFPAVTYDGDGNPNILQPDWKTIWTLAGVTVGLLVLDVVLYVILDATEPDDFGL